VDLLDHLQPPSPRRWEVLRALPLAEEEREDLERRAALEASLPPDRCVAHLPVFAVYAEALADRLPALYT
jgi:hypothetical protein